MEKESIKAKFKPRIVLGKPTKTDVVIIYKITSTDSQEKSKKDSQDYTAPTISLGVLNDKAKTLPMPKYRKEIQGILGKVVIQVKINLQKGNVVSALAIDGHILARQSAVEAAMQAKFEPSLTEFPTIYATGILVYIIRDFNGKTIENKDAKPLITVLKGGIINGKATELPTPEYPEEAKRNCAGGIVEVAVLIYEANGKLISAKAISGNELLRESAEKAALKAKFVPSIINGDRNYYVQGKIVYNFEPFVECEKNSSSNIIYGEAIELPKASFPAGGTLNGRQTLYVLVEIEINEVGDVISAKAIEGHPLFRNASASAARRARFTPTYENGKPITAIAKILYKFLPADRYETEVEVRSIEIKKLYVNK